jgi:hypothetical protein
MRVCPKCNELKSLDSFNNSSSRKNGKRCYCRKCDSVYNAQYRQSDSYIECRQKWKQENREKLAEYFKDRHVANRNQKAEYDQAYYRANADKILQQKKVYRINNRDSRNLYYRNKYKNDINHRVAMCQRIRIWHALKGIGKHTSTMELLGCTIEELRAHLEAQFQDGMSWDNRGYYGWHIDHIRPCASFDLTVPEQQKECFNYRNLQPLWARDNMSKRARVI